MKSSSEKKVSMKKHASFVSLKQRIVGLITVFVMLLQICFPSVASAARLLTNESIASAMASPSFQRSNSNAYLYQQASFDDAAYIGSQNITTFRERLVAAKSNLGKPTFIPIASDITIFVPTYPTGKLIGDVYVQNRYIRQQVFDLLGRHLIGATTSNTSETAQINELYQNAYEYAQRNPAINFGDNLNAAALINFKDMVWPEIRTIQNERVVVPVLYLTDETIRKDKVTSTRTELLGAKVVTGSISLDGAELTLGSRTIVEIAGNLNADKSSLINSNGDINLVVGGTLNLIGSSITGAKDVNILANEINVKSVLVPFQDRYGSGTKLGNISSINSTTGNISLASTGNVTFEGSTATASNGSLTINAGGNISILPLFATYQGQSTQNDWKVNSSSLDVIGSRLSAQEKISLITGGAIEIRASELISAQGGIELLAKQGIYVLNELNQTQVQRVDKIGKTKGTSSTFNTVAVRSVLDAGKGVLLATEEGDVTLRASSLRTNEGVSINAQTGKVKFLLAKEQDHYALNTVRKGTLKIKTVNAGHQIETAQYTTVIGGIQVNALYGVDVEYDTDPNKSFAQHIDDLSQKPGTQWLSTLRNNDCSLLVSGWDALSAETQDLKSKQLNCVNWKKIDFINKEWRKTNTTLSPAAMAIISVAVAVATGGSSLAITNGATLISAQTAVTSALANAAFSTLVTQASVGLISGKGLEGTLKSMLDEDSVKQLAISMATAGVMSQVNNIDFFQAAETAKDFDLLQQAQYLLAKSTMEAGFNTVISGKKLSDFGSNFEDNFKVALQSNAIASVGKYMAQEIGQAYRAEDINNLSRYIAHAGIGCLIATAQGNVNGNGEEAKNNCGSGALGSVAGELAADKYLADNKHKIDAVQAFISKEKASFDNEIATGASVAEASARLQSNLSGKVRELQKLQQTGVDIAKLAGAFSAVLVEADVNLAAQTAENAAANNALFLIPIAILLLKAADVIALGMDVLDILEGYKVSEAEGNERLADYVLRATGEKIVAKIIPGATAADKVIEVLRQKGIVSQEMVDKVGKYVAEKSGYSGSGKSATVSPSGNISKCKVDAVSCEIAIDTPQQQALLDRIKRGEDAKGELTEQLVKLTAERDGYKVLPGVFNGSNNGIDHILVKRDQSGNIIETIIVDSKQLRNGAARLSDTNSGMQLSRSWIETNMEKLPEGEAKSALRYALNNTYTPAVAGVNRETGKLLLTPLDPSTLKNMY